jgi:deferrochelatase/peroxidase EfeB
LRRGLPYGEPIAADEPATDDGQHGVIFITLNASIERQFEFVQREWVNYGNDFFQGNDKDPLGGAHLGNGKMVIPGDPDDPETRPTWICAGLPSFVETRGGDYFFLPSLTALRHIAAGTVETI